MPTGVSIADMNGLRSMLKNTKRVELGKLAKGSTESLTQVRSRRVSSDILRRWSRVRATRRILSSRTIDCDHICRAASLRVGQIACQGRTGQAGNHRKCTKPGRKTLKGGNECQTQERLGPFSMARSSGSTPRLIPMGSNR